MLPDEGESGRFAPSSALDAVRYFFAGGGVGGGEGIGGRGGGGGLLAGSMVFIQRVQSNDIFAAQQMITYQEVPA